MELLETFQQRFNDEVCNSSLTIEEVFYSFKNQKHKGVICHAHGTVHIVSTQGWKAFYHSMMSSKLSGAEKNEFRHLGLSTTALRDYYAEYLEFTPEWATVAPLLRKQEETIHAELEKLKSRSALLPLQYPISQLYTVMVEDVQYYVLPEEHKKRYSRLLMKQELTALYQPVLPSLIYGHAETTLTAAVDTLYEGLNYDCADLSGLQLGEDLKAQLCKPFDISEMDSISVKTHMAVYCLSCEDLHLLSKDRWMAFYNGVRSTSLSKTRQAAVIGQFRPASRTHLTNRIHELVKAHPSWDEINNVYENLQAEWNEYKAAVRQNPAEKTHYRNLLVEHVAAKTESLQTLLNTAPLMVRGVVEKKVHTLLRDVTEHQDVKNGSRKVEQYLLPPSAMSANLFMEFWACGRKQRYSSELEATMALTGHQAVGSKVIYSCSYCSGYHYGAPSQYEHSAEDYQAQGRIAYEADRKRANEFIFRMLTH